MVKHKRLLLPAILIVLLLFGSGLYVFRYNIGWGAPAHPNFIGYLPNALPDSVKLSDEKLIREHNQQQNTWNFVYLVNFNHDLTITEYATEVGSSARTSCQGLGNICKTYRSTNGTSYRVWYNMSNGKASSYTVSIVKANTGLNIELSSQSANTYIDYDWSPFVDSLQPVDLYSKDFDRVNTTPRSI